MTSALKQTFPHLHSFLRNYGSTIFIAVAAFAVVTYILSPGSHPLEGKPAPEAALPMLDGTVRSLADHAGRDVVVLDFWATWCPPCRDSLPEFSDIAEEFKDEPVAIYAVNVAQSPDAVQAFLHDFGIQFPVVMDESAAIAEAFRVEAFPTTLFIGPDGIIHHAEIGYGPGSDRRIRKTIRKLLGT